jgi:hypothetical protein
MSARDVMPPKLVTVTPDDPKRIEELLERIATASLPV